MNANPTIHKHEWNKVNEIKRETVQVKTFDCQCGAIRIDTTQIIDRSALLQFGTRDTKLLPLGEYENDRLVLMALEYNFKHGKRIITASLSALTDTFKELVQKAERKISKETSSMQIVADRMEKFGFGYTDPASFDVPYIVEIEPVDEKNSISLFLKSNVLIPTRSRVRDLLRQFNIKSPLLDSLKDDYDAKGRNIDLLSKALCRIIRSEIQESKKEFVLVDSIVKKIEAELCIPPEESKVLIQNNDEVIDGDKELITIINANKLLAGDIDLEGKEDVWKRPIKLKLEH